MLRELMKCLINWLRSTNSWTRKYQTKVIQKFSMKHVDCQILCHFGTIPIKLFECNLKYLALCSGIGSCSKPGGAI